MKAIRLPAPEIDLRTALWPAALLAALVTFAATLPQFQPSHHPLRPGFFTACVYVSLAGLGALRWSGSTALRRLAWAPAVAHLVLVAFATVSFVRFGYWPIYGRPDPSTLHLPWFYATAVFAVLSGVVTVAANIVVLAVNGFNLLLDLDRRSGPTPRLPSLLQHAAIVGFSAWLWIFEFSDRRLLEWLAD
jgi:hypothetical protein